MRTQNKDAAFFSENLKRLRKAKGLSQYDLADKTGLSQRMIYHYEKIVSEPPLSKIILLAKALDVKPSALLENPKDEKSLDANQFDMRSLKKLQDLLSLPPNDRAIVYRMINKLLRENMLKKQLADHVAEKATAYAHTQE